MVGLGSLMNAMMIVIGGISGYFLRERIPQKIKDAIMQAFGLAMFMIGMSGALQRVLYVSEYSRLDNRYIMIALISLIVGNVIGTLMDIEGRFYSVGEVFKRKFNQKGSFVEGFVNASIMYCVGGMAIVGSIQEGLEGRTDTLYAKGVMDGISALIYSATMGLGVVFSSLPVLLYQWSITFLSLFIKAALTNEIIDQVALIGSILVIALGMNLLKVTRINIANMLPAIFMPLLWYFMNALAAIL